MNTLKQGDLTLEDLKHISGEIHAYLAKLQCAKEVICKEEHLGQAYWAILKPEVLSEISEKAARLYLAHGGSTIANVTNHYRTQGDPRCFCGCPNSVRVDS